MLIRVLSVWGIEFCAWMDGEVLISFLGGFGNGGSGFQC